MGKSSIKKWEVYLNSSAFNFHFVPAFFFNYFAHILFAQVFVLGVFSDLFYTNIYIILFILFRLAYFALTLTISLSDSLCKRSSSSKSK